jgi:DNA-binding transcriptional LysR family regulator
VSLAPATVAKQAEQGEIDLAFHTSEDAPPGLHRRALFTEHYVLAGRRDHPRLKRKPTKGEFCRLEHVITSTAGGAFHGVTDDALAQVGLMRRVVLSVPHFTCVRTVVESTDLVAMLPERIVRGIDALRVVEPPVDVPGFEMTMLWHERSHRDPAHRWLRECIANACR